MINFPFGTMENLLFLGVPICKHITVYCFFCLQSHVVQVQKRQETTVSCVPKDSIALCRTSSVDRVFCKEQLHIYKELSQTAVAMVM